MTILFEDKIPRFQERSAETAGPSASLGMIKERATFIIWKVASRPKVFFITFGGPQAHNSSGRDNNFVARKEELVRLPSNRIVISTGA
jgi:hypothetical protein